MIAHPDEPTAAGRPRSATTCECQQQLQGPIPADWLAAAARLPGKSLHVGIALWHAAGLQSSKTVFFSNVSALRFGLDRNAKYRALIWLEEAGLVRVERKPGRSPRVTLLNRGVGDERQD
jgi:DNA-binding transcriptional ArsR family regulator